MIAYLHGFNSDVDHNNEKVVALRKSFGDALVQISYDSFAPRDGILNAVYDAVKTNIHDVVFMGTSLGAYFAMECGRIYNRPSVGINLACDPYSFFGKIESDKEYVNYVNGKVSKLSQQSICSYFGKQLSTVKSDYGYVPMILLDSDDEVFSSADTFSRFSDFGPHIFSGGNHRFSHISEAVELIRTYANS